MAFKWILSALFVLVVWLYALISGYGVVEMELLTFLLLTQIFNSFVLYLRSNLSALHLFKTDTFISILDKLIMLVILGTAMTMPAMSGLLSVQNFVLIQCISFFLTAAVAYILVRKHVQVKKWELNGMLLKKICKDSLPFTVLAGLMFLYQKTDTIILKELNPQGNEQVGVYAAAYRLIDALNMISVLFAGLLYPMFSKMIHDKENIEPLVKLAFSLLVIPAILASILFYFYADKVMALLYIHHIAESAAIFKLLGVSFVGICMTYVFGTLLTAAGEMRLLNRIAIVAVLVSVILNLWFAAKYGAVASAKISIVVFLFTAGCHTYFSFKHFGLRLRWMYLGRGIMAFTIVILLVLGIQNIGIQWLAELSLIIILAILTLIVFRLIPIAEISRLAKSEAKQ